MAANEKFKPSLPTLASELITSICKYLGYSDAVMLSLTCKSLYGYHFEAKERLQPVTWQIDDTYDGATLANNCHLRECLKKWIPQEIVYNPFVGKFTSWRRLLESLNQDRDACMLAAGPVSTKVAGEWVGRGVAREYSAAAKARNRYKEGKKPYYTPNY